MTNSEPPSPRKPVLDFDEWIAVILSFGTIALILFLGIGRFDTFFNPDNVPEATTPQTDTPATEEELPLWVKPEKP
ncbi:MAG: hypothetical protein SAJ12_03450 [Jaaginema sp. PMC 1079.18]|nr:hypothetical protein [Jaaginema sp. PMC 1080.18]MEC4850044.1 hypothetical protein [Jaaginema sp. PMC 1079.18]MEC4865144.1 hypothetical protein [Jaaginema sp. PMC 1078.18]